MMDSLDDLSEKNNRDKVGKRGGWKGNAGKEGMNNGGTGIMVR